MSRPILQNTSNTKSHFIGVFVAAAAFMSAYEFAKELFFHGTLTPWQSHSITILLTASIATILSVVARRQAFRSALLEQELEQLKLDFTAKKKTTARLNSLVSEFNREVFIVEMEINQTKSISPTSLARFNHALASLLSEVSKL
jgi:hypothetical protein